VTDHSIDLDQHRGMAAQKATELRRLLASVEANEKALRLRQDELESHLLAAPAANWHEAAEKARYLLNLFAATLTAQDPRKQKAGRRGARRLQAPFRRELGVYRDKREDNVAKGQMRSNRKRKTEDGKEQEKNLSGKR
jgi:hypothetical protein